VRMSPAQHRGDCFFAARLVRASTDAAHRATVVL